MCISYIRYNTLCWHTLGAVNRVAGAVDFNIAQCLIITVKMLPRQFTLLLLLFDAGVESQTSSATFSSTACTFYRLATAMLHFFWATAVPSPLPAARGNRPTPWVWNAALFVWVDGTQSVACSHIMYHCCVDVNRHRDLFMAISFVAGLELRFCSFSVIL